MPVRLFLPIASLLVLPTARGGHGERRLRGPRWGELRLGVLAETTDKDHLINAAACHGSSATVSQVLETGLPALESTGQREIQFFTFGLAVSGKVRIL